MKNLLPLLLTCLIPLGTLHAQTSYTWDGSVDTDFATADNWTPSGVPGSGDDITIVTTGNDPVLDGNRTVSDITMTSGTLDLNGYTLTVTDGSLNGGTIENGDLYADAAGIITFSGTVMDCELDIDARATIGSGSLFKKDVVMTDVYSWAGSTFEGKAELTLTRYNLSTGGNMFKDTTTINGASTSGYQQYMGAAVPDSFMTVVTFNLVTNMDLYIANSSSGNYFADDVTIHLSAGSTSDVIIGNNASSSSRFNGDIIMEVDSTAGAINFDKGTNEHDGNLLIGSGGYHSGILSLTAYTQIGSNSIDLSDMDHNSKLNLGPDLVLEGDLVGPTVQTTIYADCHFKGDVTLDGIFAWSGSTFDGKTDLTLTRYNLTTGGNMFKDTTTINAASTSGYSQKLGVASPDSFMAPVTFNLVTNMDLVLANSSSDNYFADDVTLNLSANSNSDVLIGNNASASSRFEGDIIMNVDSTAGAVNFKLGTNLHDGQLLIGSGGYHSGILTLKAYGQIGANVIDLSAMDHNAKLILGSDLVLEGDLIGPDVHTTLYANCHFKGDVTLPKVEIWSGSTTFDGKAELTLTRYNISVGNNMFKDTTIINAASAQGNTQRLGTALADTFLAPVTFNMIRNMSLYIANSSTGNYFADAVTLHNSGNTSSYFYIGGNTSSSAKFGGDIILEVDSTSGGITFYRGSNEHTGDMMIGSSGYHSGQLKLDAYTQTAVGTIDLTTMDHNSSLSVQTNADITADFLFAGGNTATLNGAIFRGDVDIETSSMPVTNCTFYGTTVLEKTGGVNNQNYGNNFYGATTIENSSTANYVYWGYNTTDTFYTDLTLINHSTQPLWMNYNTQGEYAGDITLQGDSAKVIRFGNTTAGQISVFNGSTDQTLSITQYLDVQAYRIEVNKSGGRLKLTDDLSVSKELKLTDGIIECQDSTVLTLADGVEPPATDSSYVEGPVKKIGNDAYTFPVGTNGHYRPIGISAPSNATDAFTAEHINEDSDPTYEHDDKEGSINEIGTNEYWMLERTVGTSDITVTLSWDDMSCGFDTLANLRVVAWKDTIWKDLGNGGTTGDTDAGTIVGSGASTIYGAYALATIDTFRCVPCRADAGEDKVIYSGYDAIVGVSAISGMTYLWSPNERIIDNSSSTTTVYPKSETVYTVTATNSQGCEASDSVFIETIALKRWPQCIGGN